MVGNAGNAATSAIEIFIKPQQRRMPSSFGGEFPHWDRAKTSLLAQSKAGPAQSSDTRTVPDSIWLVHNNLQDHFRRLTAGTIQETKRYQD